VWLLLSAWNSIRLSGVTPSMSKSWETIREPGLSFSNCGISLTFRLGSRYKVTTFALLRSSSKMSFCSIFARSPTLFFFTLALASLIRFGSMSNPKALQPYFLAAVTTIRPSPQPRS